jgi:DNA-directed RNA polymerase subunit E'/Rpb7
MPINKMFMPIKFNTTIILVPSEMTEGFDSIVYNKVRSTLENCCSKHGYIKKDSIKIIKRSAGYFKESHLNGNIAFDLSCVAEICNPAQDSIIKCEVKAKNNLGLRAIGIYEDMAILEVIIPKITSGIQSDVNIDNINIGDHVNVQVCGKKFTLYDKMISIIGKIIKDKDDIIQVQEIDDDNLSIDEEDNSEIDDNNYDGIEMFNDEDEEDEDDEGNNYKLNKGKSTKIIGGLEFDDDIEEDEDEDEEEDDELEDDIDEDDIDEDESYAEYDDFAEE